MNEKPNTYAEMQKATTTNSRETVPEHTAEPVKTDTEIDITDFSDTAIGEKISYIRPNLEGTEDTISKFQVFPPDFSKEPIKNDKTGSESWKVEMLLTWESKNVDGIQNKEYISGAKVWKNRDGQPNTSNGQPVIDFWYDKGVANESTSSILWEKVAECLKIPPADLSPRQFVVFLNSKPKFVIKPLKVKNFMAKPGQPSHVYKNMPGEYKA